MVPLEKAKLIQKEAYELCAVQMPVKACWLYGSYARGDQDDQSDVDILITVNAQEEQLRGLRRTVAIINSRLSLKYDVTVSITLKSAASFDRYAEYVPYYQNVRREGLIYAG